MSDFLAAIVTAAQTPPASPMIRPLLAPYFAPMPPIAGDGLATAGGDMGDPLLGPAGLADAAAPDALDIMPLLLPLGDYDGDTAHLPWPEAEALGFAVEPGAPASPEVLSRSTISQPIVADASAEITPRAAGDSFTGSRPDPAPDDRHDPVHRNSPPEAMRDGAVSRAAPHVSGDTSGDENWNAENPPRSFGHDADAAEDADRPRFHLRPPRRQRSPRPVFGPDTHAARGVTADENVAAHSFDKLRASSEQRSAARGRPSISLRYTQEVRSGPLVRRHPSTSLVIVPTGSAQGASEVVFRADAHPAPVATTDEDRAPGRNPASSVTAVPPAGVSLQRRVLAGADAVGAAPAASSSLDPVKPAKRTSLGVFPAMTTTAADPERSGRIAESSHLLRPAPDLARARPLASEVSAAFQREQSDPSVDPDLARATKAGETTRHAISGHTAEAASPTSEQGAKPATRELLAAPTIAAVTPETHGARAGVRPSVSASPGVESAAPAPSYRATRPEAQKPTTPASNIPSPLISGRETATSDENLTQAGSLRHAPVSRLDTRAAPGAMAGANVRSNDFSRSPRATATEVATTNRSIFRAAAQAAPAASKKTQATSIIRPAPEAPAPVASTTATSGRSQAQEPGPAEPLPAIRVTIGRIEVRARSVEAAPVPARPTPRPPVSLDAYLGRATRGNR